MKNLTVADLIELLQEEDPDRIVVMSKDGEGNSYSPLSDFSSASYVAECTWSGEIGIEELTDELKAMGYTEEDVIEGGVPALVLWPTN